jgi:hypothetical protein
MYIIPYKCRWKHAGQIGKELQTQGAENECKTKRRGEKLSNPKQ